ncbi:hypothetical protein TRFO_33955 [Tritrichomonas foetus]|uniref:Protein kinase domain-containing protein n=1 Tax=Tritrichomonas foetus TaxID=1144522 RepID=A0A1J4JPX1_9EUKA|nr:hypothetical protein TRFO_33955 [Tritrichomonas foetus]|eukprot:OHS99581.1 hypothetical protein TRFO_33955 [Tritrichomonas foetus]
MNSAIAENQQALENHGYTLLECIGEGGFAKCYKVHSSKYDQVFACKIMKISQPAPKKLPIQSTEENIQCNQNCHNINHIHKVNDKNEKKEDKKEKKMPLSVLAEIESLVNIIHPNVIHIYDYFQERDSVYMILEYCNGGSVADIIKKNGPYEYPVLVDYAKQIIRALQSIHALHIAHRDIKPANIFIDSYDRPKLADFGLAEHTLTPDLSKRTGGSLPFMAPEFFKQNSTQIASNTSRNQNIYSMNNNNNDNNNNNNNFPNNNNNNAGNNASNDNCEYDPFVADIWALGITFYVMAVGKLPYNFQTRPELKQCIMSCNIAVPDSVEPKFADLLRMMLRPNPNKRANLNELLNLPLFKKCIRVQKSMLNTPFLDQMFLQSTGSQQTITQNPSLLGNQLPILNQNRAQEGNQNNVGFPLSNMMKHYNTDAKPKANRRVRPAVSMGSNILMAPPTIPFNAKKRIIAPSIHTFYDKMTPIT